MEGLFSWVGELINWFGSLIPRLLIVRSTHGGVKFVRGKDAVRLEPGLHVYWPFVTEIQLVAKERQSDPIPPLNLTTLDGIKVIANPVIVYRISDPLKAIAKTWDHANTVFDVTSIAAARVIKNHRFDFILRNHLLVDRELKDIISSKLRKYGVTVYEASIVGFSEGQVNMVIGNNNILPLEEE